jgi:hypothetical protein
MADIPLVKGNVSIPFNLNTLQSKVFTKFKNTLGFKYNDLTITNFLINIKEYALDILKSSSALNYEFYDLKKVKQYIYEYENDEYKNAEEIDWFLTFEIFRYESKKLK